MRPSHPDESHWAVNTTVRCQHRCIYCFEGARPGKVNVPVEETRRIIEAAARRVPAVIFMGAEPTLNPALVELVALARSRGLRVSISTNGLRLANPRYLHELVAAGLSTVELSFPYPDAAVYAAVTRAKPAGFDRLLEAVDNIERVNREQAGQEDARAAPPRLMVAVNVVVSAFNYERLPEIGAHLGARLGVTRPAVTLKRITFGPEHQAPAHLARCRVSLQDLRRVLPAFLSRYSHDPTVRVRDFPLCAIPGWEHRDFDLQYWLDGVEVAHNFARQDELHDMYPAEKLRARHPSDWLCAECTLDPVCLHRGLFDEASPRRGDAPVPSREPLPAVLTELVQRSERGRRVLAEPGATRRPPDAPALLLRELSRALPPGARLEGTGVRVYPTTNGTLALEEESGAAAVKVGPVRDGWRAYWLAGNLAVAAETDGPPLRAAIGPLVRVLAGLSLPDLARNDALGQLGHEWLELRRVVTAAWLAEPVGAPPQCEVRRDRDELRGLLLTVPLGVEAAQALFWVEPAATAPRRLVVLFSSASVPDETAERRLRRWLDALRDFADPAQRLLEGDLSKRVVALSTDAGSPTPLPAGVSLSTHSGILLVWRRATRQMLPCFTLPASETPTPGFLCGDLVLRAHPDLVRGADGPQVVQALGRAVLQARREGTAATTGASRSSFLRHVWQALGPDLLWPSRGAAIDCLAGQVSTRSVGLRFGHDSRHRLELTFQPRAWPRPGHGSGGAVRLSSRWVDGTRPDPAGVAVVDVFARRLKPSPAQGPEGSR
jgi:pyruvate-formate lyase-activating enzyme